MIPRVCSISIILFHLSYFPNCCCPVSTWYQSKLLSPRFYSIPTFSKPTATRSTNSPQIVKTNGREHPSWGCFHRRCLLMKMCGGVDGLTWQRLLNDFYLFIYFYYYFFYFFSILRMFVWFCDRGEATDSTLSPPWLILTTDDPKRRSYDRLSPTNPLL